jgi:hypothetical protein
VSAAVQCTAHRPADFEVQDWGPAVLVEATCQECGRRLQYQIDDHEWLVDDEESDA